MGSQSFQFTWNNHEKDLVSSFKQLLTTEGLTDVTLSCEGKIMKAHRLILSASSPFFKNIFMDNPNQYPVIVLIDTKYSDLKMILDFIYNGEINIPRSQLARLLKTAEALKIKGLIQSEEAPEEMANESVEVCTSLPRKRKRRRKRSSSESDDVVEIPSTVKPLEPPLLSRYRKKKSFTSFADNKIPESTQDEVEIIENTPIIYLEDDDEIEIVQENESEHFEFEAPSVPISLQNLVSTTTSDPSTFVIASTSTPISNEIKISDVRTDDNDRLSENSATRDFSLQYSSASFDTEPPATSSQTGLNQSVPDDPREEPSMSEPSLAGTSLSREIKRRKRSSSESVEIPSKVKSSEPQLLSSYREEKSFTSFADNKIPKSTKDEVGIIESPPIIHLD
ncbi:protein tramtrack, alpha isoform-like [Centruroides sculpturatus]|uniref:protein tramtrack, alpha isoform-like n=1 Tax=Centruroides sculpturatus TaxID=218467 RepID=UPI000C6DB816|nr:protein tramtrack, alpha isoform-like [Centruroides sculpturatus]